MGTSVLRRSNPLTRLVGSSVYRAAAADANADSGLASFLNSRTPVVIPVATRYMGFKRMWKFVPKLIGEDHVKPDVHVRHDFEQRKRAIEMVDADLNEAHDIGLSRVDSRQRRMDRAKELREIRKRLKSNSDLERASRLRQATFDAEEAEYEDGVEGAEEERAIAKAIAERSGVFEHLFGPHAYFHNVADLQIAFDDDSDESIVAPVFYGNRIEAGLCRQPPGIAVDQREGREDLWTLVMTSPDQHVAQTSGEFLHWMVGNVRMTSSADEDAGGDVVVPYFPPFPPRGLGPLRYVFVLYLQSGPIDFSSISSLPFTDANALAQRGFSTYDFYRRHQDVLTPAALKFFQSEHEPKTTNIFYDRLEMKEPSYAYDWPEPPRPLQSKFQEKAAFNEYLDLYRDRKDINEQVLLKRLSMMTSPFEGYPPPDPWPNAVMEDIKNTPTWLRDENSAMRLRRGKWRDLDIRD